MNFSSFNVAIDASRNRSGGAKAHLIGLIEAGNPLEFNIKEVHVWSYNSLLTSLPDRSWLIKHSHNFIEKSIFHQLFWQFFIFPIEFQKSKCDIVLNTDAGTISYVKPSVTMSRDMLSYEPGEMKRYGFSFARVRLLLLRYVQNRSLRNSNGAIFLTKYASSVIQKSSGPIERVAHIPHGVGSLFRLVSNSPKLLFPYNQGIKLLYISNTDLYKHQWHVVHAAELLRLRGHNVSLTLVGGGIGLAKRKLLKQIAISDPDGKYIFPIDFVPHSRLTEYLSEADIFIFASSCENMPNTLIEAMAAGLPIACSSKGPMPEVLEDAGVYFDPENSISIANSVQYLIENEEIQNELSRKSQLLSLNYSWEKCSTETWKFIQEIFNSVKKLN